jgi:hypothetical protein
LRVESAVSDDDKGKVRPSHGLGRLKSETGPQILSCERGCCMHWHGGCIGSDDRSGSRLCDCSSIRPAAASVPWPFSPRSELLKDRCLTRLRSPPEWSRTDRPLVLRGAAEILTTPKGSTTCSTRQYWRSPVSRVFLFSVLHPPRLSSGHPPPVPMRRSRSDRCSRCRCPLLRFGFSRPSIRR